MLLGERVVITGSRDSPASIKAMPFLIPIQPTLQSERLDLRPFTLEDAPVVQALAGAREVAATTLHVPHPYEDGMAEEWIRTHGPSYAEASHATFAVVERSSGDVVGAIGLIADLANSRAEVGYWIGVPFWNRGYATEAGRIILRFGFEELGLDRIFAAHFGNNPASGHVMKKLGMRYEGRLRQHIRKWGRFEDLEYYGTLRGEWEADGRKVDFT